MTMIEEGQSLSADDQQYYDALQTEYGDACTEDFKIRMARAFRTHKKNRMQVTMTEAKRILTWRAAHGADSILTRELDHSKVYFDCWPGQLYGEDSEGHLVAVDRIAEIQIDAFQKHFGCIDLLLPHRVQYMERIQWEKAAVSKRLGHRVYKHICIVDLKGLGMKHVSRSIINYLKPIFDIGQLYYPETLHRLYLINAPFVFYGAWKMIASLIDPETREKIQVFKEGDKFLETAQNHGIPLESLPAYLGGGHPGRPMNNTFKPSVADAPLPAPQQKATEMPADGEKNVQGVPLEAIPAHHADLSAVRATT